MMRCPFCRKPSHVRTSRYLADSVKQCYYQCIDVFCSATFRTIESIDDVIHQPTKKEEPEPAPVAPQIRPLLDRARSSMRH